MIIVGAGAAGKEILHILVNEQQESDIIFYDDNKKLTSIIAGGIRYPVIHEPDKAKTHFKKDIRFVLGIGHPRIKERLCNKMISMGGKLHTTLSKLTVIMDNGKILDGCFIHPGCMISFDTTIKTGVTVHANTTIGHQVSIGKFSMIGPGCNIIGPSTIDSHCYIGAGTIIYPNIKIGKRAIISPGSIIKNNIPEYYSV